MKGECVSTPTIQRGGTSAPTGPLSEPPYRLSEAARRLGITADTARRQIARGTFPVPTILIGTRRFVPRQPLDEFLAGR